MCETICNAATCNLQLEMENLKSTNAIDYQVSVQTQILSYDGLDTSCIERVVWLGSACPWRALGGTECPAVQLCMSCRTGRAGEASNI